MAEFSCGANSIHPSAFILHPSSFQFTLPRLAFNDLFDTVLKKSQNAGAAFLWSRVTWFCRRVRQLLNRDGKLPLTWERLFC